MFFVLLMVEYKIQPPHEIIEITTTGQTDEYLETTEATGSTVTTTWVTKCRAKLWKCSVPRISHLIEEELMFSPFVLTLI